MRTWFPVRTGVLRRHTDDVKAVDDVCFTIEAGTTVGLVGESGSGKSTIGKTILKLVPATSGQVLFDGRDILPMSESEFRPLRREMQMIFQDPVRLAESAPHRFSKSSARRWRFISRK